MSRFAISRRTAIAGDVLLAVVWLALAVVSGLDDWGWGWTMFFGMATGERVAMVAQR